MSLAQQRQQLRPQLVRNAEPGIEWREYPRIEPGTYRAYCKSAKRYRDPAFKRWTCLLRWNVLADDLQTVIAIVPCWLLSGKSREALGFAQREVSQGVGACERWPTCQA